MKTPPLALFVHALLVAAAAALLSSCGGGGGNTSPNSNVTYSATCWDGTSVTSTVSAQAAAAQCPVDTRSTLVTSVPAPSYTGAYASEKIAVFNRLNEDRERCGFGKLAQNTLLDKAAQNHADYLVANRFSEGHSETIDNSGYKGENPSARISQAGYQGAQTSEGISAEMGWGTLIGSVLRVVTGGDTIQLPITANPPLVDGLRGLYAAPYHLVNLMFGYRDIGIGSYYKDESDQYSTYYRKALVMDYGTRVGQVGQQLASDNVSTFPCADSADLSPYFFTEEPNPFVDMKNGQVWGQPVYVVARSGATLTLSHGTITRRGGAPVPTKRLVHQNASTMQGEDVRKDPHGILGANEVFLVPTVALAENATYDVVLQGTNTLLITSANPTGAWSKSYSFSTSVYVHEVMP